MQIQKLEQNWTLTVLGENVFHIPEKQIPAKVPSTVYSTLLEQNLMPDPFYRDNELDATKLCENDFAYETDFLPDASIRREDRIFLRFEGIDTLAEISLDGAVLGTAENMNRVYEFDITEAVKLSCTFASCCTRRTDISEKPMQRIPSEGLRMPCRGFRTSARRHACSAGTGARDFLTLGYSVRFPWWDIPARGSHRF